uniref:Uncharacterized protein n=1 Tax=Arundo donax TaxID=35708 RepID=A0A0A8Z1J9_ARUDO
MGKDCVAVFG